MNDLLGAKEAGEGETLGDLPKLKWESPSAHPRTFSRMSPKRPCQLQKADRDQSLFPKPANATYAMHERAIWT